jgi:hypothetical protein
MDNYISKDKNNPINQNEKKRYCEICGTEETKTYFVDNTSICEDCHERTEDNPYLTTETKAD